MDSLAVIVFAALFTAYIMVRFWKQVIGLLLILFLAVVFVGIFGLAEGVHMLDYSS
ncbi:hypothetical protein ACIB24_05385 [Spongisporangium articulatum]|uniref:Uncharacterized protein n=1 Tax=Spongisporangium articulatum TaxID=3362603 RepID=A0ABW8AJF4_9ACTN